MSGPRGVPVSIFCGALVAATLGAAGLGLYLGHHNQPFQPGRPTVGEVSEILILCSYTGSSSSAYITIGRGGDVQLRDSERLWFISGGGLREMLAQINAHTEWRCQVPE